MKQLQPATEHGFGQLEEISEEEFNALHKSAQRGKKKQKLKRESFGDPADLDSFRGPWASYEIGDICDGEKAKEPDDKKMDQLRLLPEPKFASQTGEYSILHDPSRTFILTCVPNDQDSFTSKAVPNSIVHTWIGHSQGIFQFRLFPHTFHLLLTCSLDHTIKLWDLYGERKCIRTYYGHGKAVRAVEFNESGSQFLSASLDKNVKLWNTESGECVNRFRLDAMPFVIRFLPNSNDTRFLVGTSDNLVLLYSVEQPDDPLREFQGHLKPINDIVFLPKPDGSLPVHFMTTSDDRTCRIWNLETGKCVRYIANPTGISTLSHCLIHPLQQTNGQCSLLAQSSKNKIVTFQYTSLPEPALSLSTKSFYGYRLNGYACGISLSPDGRCLAGGDGDGNLIAWEWERALFIQKIAVHEKPILCLQWHPIHNFIITSSLDGTIKLVAFKSK